MEIKVTHLLDADCSEFSASVAERGQNAGPETWANAKDQAAERPLVSTPDQLKNAREYFQGFGAWDREELAAMSDQEINALLVQDVSHNIREVESLCPGDGACEIDWIAAEELAQSGTIGGQLYCSGVDVFFYVGS